MARLARDFMTPGAKLNIAKYRPVPVTSDDQFLHPLNQLCIKAVMRLALVEAKSKKNAAE
jgi:hypothetical protein